MLAVLLGLLLASTWAQDSSIATSDATTPEATETVSLWLPMNGPADLSIQASIVSAAPDKVAYVLQCKPDNSNVLCRAYDPPITITQGESTIDFVHTYFRNPEETATLIKPITVRCKMGGAESSRNRAATSALCTIGSDISGLGVIASTSRLASSEITYSPVTLTAGVAKMVAATATPAGTEVTASSTAAAEIGPRITAMAIGGAVGMAILANM